MTPDLDWTDDAACRDHPEVAFFGPVVEKHTSGPVFDPGPALAVCAECPVRAQCRAWAERNGDIVRGVALWGVVGGVGPARIGRPGGPTKPLPCGTPAAYQRHTRRGEDPCEPCRDAHTVDGRIRADRRRLRSVGWPGAVVAAPAPADPVEGERLA